ncbi:MAG: FixH family protein [Melioribacteraceae bacterium]|nr:FixH family protein [Melioribacteraceae bacterium]
MQKKKSSFWGYGIALTYIVFFIAVMAVVFFSFTKDVNLVTDDYYQEEIEYQDKINILEKTNKLNYKPIINKQKELVEIGFPDSLDYSKISGKIFFYRPSNSKNDFTIELDLSTDFTQKISTDKLTIGYWKIHLSWEYDNQNYLIEESFFME